MGEDSHIPYDSDPDDEIDVKVQDYTHDNGLQQRKYDDDCEKNSSNLFEHPRSFKHQLSLFL